MKDKIKKIIWSIMAGVFFASALVPQKVYAAAVGDVNDIIDGIVAYKEKEAGCDSVEEWVKKLAETAGDGSEWFVIGLAAEGRKADFSAYYPRLVEYAANTSWLGATAKQRLALALIACGAADHEYVRTTADEAPGKLGIMSRIFGLHIANNGVGSGSYTAEDLIENILSYRLSDGGWAIMGDRADVDVTAMALQALAPYYNEKEEVKAAVDKALSLLSERQLDDGGYAGFGSENPESAAQVIIALTSLGIDPYSDARFIKNGNSVPQGLLKYRRADGSFAHTDGGEANTSATYQAFLAFVSIKRLYNGQGPVYIFTGEMNPGDGVEGSSETAGTGEMKITEKTAEENKGVETVTETPAPTAEAHTSGKAENAVNTEPAKGLNIKVFLYAGILLLGVIASVVLRFKGHKSKKNYVFVWGICLGLGVLVFFTRFSTGLDFYSGTAAKKENAVGTVTITIRCDTVKDLADPRYVPSDGIILPVTAYEIEENETVYDVLVEAVREHNIQMENHGSSTGAHGMVYISGIAYLYEQQFGELSGWVYHVNGVQPSYGCGDYVLSDGDVIEWLYTRDLGRDVSDGSEVWK
ncbi:MAG: DUF4430 domain-containing protein [Lachnospiraceae bacterium]|nr:DUF4430 domain-containing protein [Lachnospiraceae bacterium]